MGILTKIYLCTSVDHLWLCKISILLSIDYLHEKKGIHPVSIPVWKYIRRSINAGLTGLVEEIVSFE